MGGVLVEHVDAVLAIGEDEGMLCLPDEPELWQDIAQVDAWRTVGGDHGGYVAMMGCDGMGCWGAPRTWIGVRKVVPRC